MIADRRRYDVYWVTVTSEWRVDARSERSGASVRPSIASRLNISRPRLVISTGTTPPGARVRSRAVEVLSVGATTACANPAARGRADDPSPASVDFMTFGRRRGSATENIIR